MSTTAIAVMRAQLIKEGLLMPSRKSNEPPKVNPNPPEPASLPDAAVPPSMLDHQAMTALADMIDLDNADLDDEEIHKRLIRQCVRFAFDPKLHPDTRMSASQMWQKLKDKAKAGTLGPGTPLTFEAGVIRLSDILIACGPKMTVAAVNVAFEVKEEPSGEAKTEQASTSVGTEEAPSPA